MKILNFYVKRVCFSTWQIRQFWMAKKKELTDRMSCQVMTLQSNTCLYYQMKIFWPYTKLKKWISNCLITHLQLAI